MLDIDGNRLSYSSDREIGNGSEGAGALRASCHKNNFTRDDFCFQAEVEVGEGLGDYSPTLWKKKNNDDDDDSCEFSPLLPCDHKYSNLSRLQAILEARKELMEMIRDMPESSYELSLKDIVDERQKNIEEVYKDDDDDERSFHFETEAQLKKKKKKKQQQQQQKSNNKKKKKMKRMESSGSNKFSRSASMDSEIFLIKMFSMPSCFGSNSKKKNIATHKNGSSKVTPRNSFEILEDDHHNEPRFRRIFSAGENNNRGKFFSSGIRSNSDSSSTSRHVMFLFLFF